MTHVADRDLAFLHRLEQRALHLGRCTVDLVGEQKVGEDWAAVRAELVGLLVEDLGTEDVGWQQVDRELDTRKGQGDRLGNCCHEQRLGDPGDALQQ